ncbi:hypothetical protein COO60DRAFT_519129 [Scenedesmus sp. NREL 46B-D3]|nr:hypothetical protein COO60DRAFT_519129 [Scenedesmus sp. NREL 46B-D3]
MRALACQVCLYLCVVQLSAVSTPATSAKHAFTWTGSRLQEALVMGQLGWTTAICSSWHSSTVCLLGLNGSCWDSLCKGRMLCRPWCRRVAEVTPAAIAVTPAAAAVQLEVPSQPYQAACRTERQDLPEHVDFLEKIAYRTGLGDDTAVVPAIQSGDTTQTGEMLSTLLGACVVPTAPCRHCATSQTTSNTSIESCGRLSLGKQHTTLLQAHGPPSCCCCCRSVSCSVALWA